MSAKLWITGHAGLLGSHLSPAARAAGWEVLTTTRAALDRSRRVSFGFRLDDQALLEEIQRLTQAQARQLDGEAAP